MVQSVEALAAQILHHKQLYYSGNPKMSDVQYDQLEAELRALDPEHPVLSLVGSETHSSSEKALHGIPMLSLAKTYDPSELVRWSKDEAVLGMAKIDGNSLSIIYKQGVLVQAKTRGNGYQGEDVSSKIRWVGSVPKKLSESIDIEIRGELYIGDAHFVKIAHEMEQMGLEKPTNPRNIVAGILGRKQHLQLAAHFDFFAFDCISDEKLFSAETAKLAWLKDAGFQLAKHRLLTNAEQIEHFLSEIKVMLAENSYGIDGAVFTYDRIALHQEMGATAHHPRYRLSFKWQGDSKVTQIKAIDWKTSRFGVVTPVAKVESVQLSGANITNVTLHNAAHVEMFDLKQGDKIEIVRSGEVIPKFLKVIQSGEGSHVLPENCPSCGSSLSFDEVRLICLNSDYCEAQLVLSILNWLKSAQIDDLSEKRLQALLDANLVNEIPDLYKLAVEDFLKIPLTKEKMAAKLYKNIQGSKNLSLARFLTGLGIAGTGLTTWEVLITHFGDLPSLQKLEVADLLKINGFAEKNSEQVVRGLVRKRELIEKLIEVGIKPSIVAVNEAGVLSGQVFVVTGTLSRPRSEIAQMIRDAGGKISSSVSKKTTAVITGSEDSQSSKMQQALKLQVPIWDEVQLNLKIEGGNNESE